MSEHQSILRRRQFNGWLASGSITLGLSLPGAGWAQSGSKRGGDELVLGLPYSPISLNPATTSGYVTGQPGPQLFASPLRFDHDWQAQPYLARDWKLSADGRTLAMNLVDNAMFHDGRPITPEDFVFSLLALKKYHPFNTMFEPIDTVEKTGEHAVAIRLKHPHPALYLAMSPIFCPIMPRHIYDDGQVLNTHPRNVRDVVGSGPFRFVEFSIDQRIVLDRFDDFFIKQRPHFKRIIYDILPDPTATFLGLQNGGVQYDSFASVALIQIKQLEKSPRLNVTNKGYVGIGAMNWLAFNLKRSLWDNKKVRHAIAYAIDKEFIIQKMQYGLSRRAYGPIADSSPFYKKDLPRFNFDLNKAEQLLDEAGLTKNKDGTRLELTIAWIPGSVEFGKNVAEAIKSQLMKVGVRANVRTFPDFASWNKAVSLQGDYDLSVESVFTWGDPIIGVHRTYLSSNIRPGVPFSNTTRYNNPKVDEILQQAGQEMDEQKRRKLYETFQAIIVEDMPIHYLHTMPYYTIQDKAVVRPPEGLWGSMAPFDQAAWAKE